MASMDQKRNQALPSKQRGRAGENAADKTPAAEREDWRRRSHFREGGRGGGLIYEKASAPLVVGGSGRRVWPTIALCQTHVAVQQRIIDDILYGGN